MRVNISATLTNNRPPDTMGMAEGSHAWRVRLTFDGRQLTIPFYTGPMAGEPDAACVVDCLTMDTYAGELSFSEFCGEFGYDEDSRRAEEIWRKCRDIGHKVRRFLGDRFDEVADIARESRDGTVKVAE